MGVQLITVLRAIAEAPDEAAAMLAASPGLARERLVKGDIFLEAITHYAYAGDTALHIAAAAYETGLVKRLLEMGADVSAANRRGAQALHYAADGLPGSAHWDPKRQGEVIARLIAAGADPDAMDKSGVAPLHRAVRTRCSGAVKALIAGGADAGKKNGAGSTPMDLAVKLSGRGGSGSAEARAEQAKIVALLS